MSALINTVNVSNNTAIKRYIFSWPKFTEQCTGKNRREAVKSERTNGLEANKKSAERKH